MIKSPLRYPGGKSKSIELISPLIPKFQEYREPFLGGGSVFIDCKQKYPAQKYWINDLHQNLYYFWKIIQSNPSFLLERIKEWKDYFSDGRELFYFLKKGINEFSDLDKAAAFFVLNRITFSGTAESGGYSQAAFEKRFTDSSIDRLNKLLQLIDQNILITNSDYQEVVEAEGENVFIFLDPPYYSATKSALYGKNGNLHKSFDHQRFASVMKNCDHKWLITYDNNEYIKNLFSFAYISEWSLTYGMRNVNTINQSAKELFISNYSINHLVENKRLSLFT